jgi:hypothetical protein
MNKSAVLFHCALCLIILLSACSGNTPVATVNPLIGKWSTADSINLEFKENGKALFNGEEITYTYGNDSLTLHQGSNMLYYHFKIEKEKLEVSGGDLKSPMLFAKSKGGSILSRKGNTDMTASIQVQKENNAAPVEKEATKQTTAEKETVKQTMAEKEPAKQATSKTIYDTWISAIESMELRADGNCIYAGKAYKYTYDGSRITLTTPTGDVTMGCVLNGDQLTLTTNQGSFVYSRKGTKASSTANATGGSRGLELVGKWCYMSNSQNISFNDCFTIYANGTYSSNSDNSMSSSTGSVAGNGSDNGTWTYDGNMVHIQSRLNGAQSYTLQKTYNKNGDPCIVIGGKTYFSAYQHARW